MFNKFRKGKEKIQVLKNRKKPVDNNFDHATSPLTTCNSAGKLVYTSGYICYYKGILEQHFFAKSFFVQVIILPVSCGLLWKTMRLKV